MPAFRHLPGDRHGRLVIIAREPGGAIRCRCDCGNEHVVSISQWSNGKRGRPGVKSCGCLMREIEANGLRAKAREIGVSVATVRGRMRRGESRDEALRPAFYGEVLTARDGFEGTRADHARRLGISRQAIDHRIKSGWDPHDAISLPREG